MAEKITRTQIAVVRTELLRQQSGRCAVCQLPIPKGKEVLDHDHTTGAVRGVLHAGCNSLLGKVENNYKRYGVQNVFAFVSGVAAYLRAHQVNTTGLIHPLHKTEEEKRVARNAAARKRRANNKKVADGKPEKD